MFDKIHYFQNKLFSDGEIGPQSKGFIILVTTKRFFLLGNSFTNENQHIFVFQTKTTHKTKTFRILQQLGFEVNYDTAYSEDHFFESFLLLNSLLEAKLFCNGTRTRKILCENLSKKVMLLKESIGWRKCLLRNQFWFHEIQIFGLLRDSIKNEELQENWIVETAKPIADDQNEQVFSSESLDLLGGNCFCKSW